MNLGQIGFGTYKITDEEKGIEVIQFALKNGYKIIDTASFYGNEEIIGKATENFNKNDFFITTKVWPSDLTYDGVMRSFEKSYNNLREKIDLLLIHWPHPDNFITGYKALEKLKEDRLVKEIGVANFEIRHLEALKNHCNIKPYLNQVEAHPMLAQNELARYLKNENIKLQAWSPTARGQYYDNKIILDIAKKHNVTPTQVILNWHLDRGYHPIPKSSNPKHIIENIESTNFKIGEDDLMKLNSLDAGLRVGPHPELFPYE
ncbi:MULTISPECIES: aldo/keto reductase [unclassified Gemella]|uniref:aldo/keto reductase n=1 Tax=unclassified Gemella TaxID=2624949 RepID=UPI001C043F5B|nr:MULTISPECIES: aldo/keto reductase [unclassified Gemella]MBU0278087.1 aldo/keto reductase [Gemella sp. zg-1178]QWQ38387.1 aldo/keto reductase [Gemella sp. zg-570]